jgi:endoglucanase
MNEEQQIFLEKLIGTQSVSGFEHNFQDLIKNTLLNYGQLNEISNNLIFKLDENNGPKILLEAHADQVGAIVSNIDSSGILKFNSVGEFDSLLALGSEVWLHPYKKEIISGVIFGSKKNTFIDCGFIDREDAFNYINIGDPITWPLRMIKLKNGFLSAPGLDNKIGILILLEVAKKLENLKNCSFYIGSLTREETTGDGAATISSKQFFNIVLSVDTTPIENAPPIELGKGPTIAFGSSVENAFSRMIENESKKEEIKYQREAVEDNTYTNADCFRRAGALVSVLSIPCKYTHSSIEVINIDDVTRMIDLLIAICKKLDKNNGKI